METLRHRAGTAAHRGRGHFTPTWFAQGLDFHEAKAVDLDGDGRPDIVSKPYNYGSPRIDVFMNQGVKGARR
jgi:hypothetical protein